MTTKELIEILKTYPLDTTVSVAHYDQGSTLSKVEMVAPNNGPSIYAEGWDRQPNSLIVHDVTEALAREGVYLTENQAQIVAEMTGRARDLEAELDRGMETMVKALINLRNASLQYKMDKDDLEIEDANAALATVSKRHEHDYDMKALADRIDEHIAQSESQREAAGLADEKPDGQAENK